VNPNNIIATLIEIACHAHALVGKNPNRDYGALTTALRQLNDVQVDQPDATTMTGPARAAKALESFLVAVPYHTGGVVPASSAPLPALFTNEATAPPMPRQEHEQRGLPQAAWEHRVLLNLQRGRGGENEDDWRDAETTMAYEFFDKMLDAVREANPVRDENAAFDRAFIGYRYGPEETADAKNWFVTGYRAAGTTAPQAAAYKRQRDNLLAFMQSAPVSSGVCCCGDDMNKHGNPMDCGHNPVDMWDNSVASFVTEFEKFDAAAPAAPMIYPATFTDELKSILGTMCFQVIDFMPVYRLTGHEIPTGAEHEQAFVIDRMLRCYLACAPGEKWTVKFNDELRALHKQARAVAVAKTTPRAEPDLPEKEACKFCGIKTDTPCETAPPDICEHAINHENKGK
jgi:hypothetical protein